MKRRLSVAYAASAFHLILFRPTEWLVRRFSSIGQHPLFAPPKFGWIPRIEAGRTAIRKDRFTVLDSWRGIAACMVALFHFNVFSHFYAFPLIRNAYIFVDFFFVLSGFIIAANYGDKLLNGFGIGRFIWLRIGRVWPLHLALLGAFIGMQAAKLVWPQLMALSPDPPFQPPRESLDTIIANVFLIHSLGLFDFHTWNAPSWSISVEFYTYIIFAVCVTWARERALLVISTVLILSPVVLWATVRHIDTTYDYGLIRCLYGFSAGVITWEVYRRLRPIQLSGTAAEITALLLVIVFVSMAGTRLSLAAPYVFSMVVLVFAFEAGAVSRLLMGHTFLLLGTLSYSIYMTHFFIVGRFNDVGKVAPYFGVNLTTLVDMNGTNQSFLGIERWQGDLWYVVYMMVVVAVSFLTYHAIEKPSRHWFRKTGTAHAAPLPSG